MDKICLVKVVNNSSLAEIHFNFSKTLVALILVALMVNKVDKNNNNNNKVDKEE